MSKNSIPHAAIAHAGVETLDGINLPAASHLEKRADGSVLPKSITSANRQPSDGAGQSSEVGYLAFKTGLNRKDAFIAYLKEAGVWEEDRLAPSILPGQKKRKNMLPDENEFISRARAC